RALEPEQRARRVVGRERARLPDHRVADAVGVAAVARAVLAELIAGAGEPPQPLGDLGRARVGRAGLRGRRVGAGDPRDREVLRAVDVHDLAVAGDPARAAGGRGAIDLLERVRIERDGDVGAL